MAFGRELLPAGGEVPGWAIVLAPGVVRMTGRDIEQSYWADRRAIQPRCGNRRHSKRAPIRCWTRKSRSKMTLTLASLDWSYLDDADSLPAMITLTYSRDWVTVAPDREAVGRHLAMFRRRWERAWGAPLAAAWKLEFQRRGAPHVHIGPVVIPLGFAGQRRRVQHDADMELWRAAGELGRRPYLRPAVGDGLPFHRWLSLAWADIVNHPDPGERKRHELAGTNVDYKQGLRCADPKRLGVYFSKHSYGGAKEYQNKCPDEWDQRPGRFWGVWTVKPAKTMVELEKHEHLAVSRALRHLSERGRYWNPETRTVETRRASREPRVPRRRIDPAIYRLIAESTGASPGKVAELARQEPGGIQGFSKRKVRRPVRRLKSHRGFVCVNDGPGLAFTLARLVT